MFYQELDGKEKKAQQSVLEVILQGGSQSRGGDNGPGNSPVWAQSVFLVGGS